jgi:hypothetical protein
VLLLVATLGGAAAFPWPILGFLYVTIVIGYNSQGKVLCLISFSTVVRDLSFGVRAMAALCAGYGAHVDVCAFLVIWFGTYVLLCSAHQAGVSFVVIDQD